MAAIGNVEILRNDTDDDLQLHLLGRPHDREIAMAQSTLRSMGYHHTGSEYDIELNRFVDTYQRHAGGASNHTGVTPMVGS